MDSGRLQPDVVSLDGGLMPPRAPLGIRLLATGFGLGLWPYGPGTLTSLVWTMLYASSGLGRLPVGVHLIGIGLLFLIGLYSSARMERCYGPDPSRIVIDEWVGQWIALLSAPAEWRFYGLAFALFRLLDIGKPWPLGALQRLPHGWGVMLDDVAAGLLAALGVWAISAFGAGL
jgi:phosphatidylglycerophosphatase A